MTGRRAIVWALVVVVLTSASSWGAFKVTYAAFSSTSTNPSNSFSAAAASCTGGTLTANPNADSGLNQTTPNSNSGSSTLFKVQSGNVNNERGLVKFALPTIPAGCSITSATLRLEVGYNYALGRTIQARTVTSAWTENAVTWNTQPSSTTTDMATQPAAVVSVTFTVTNQIVTMYTGTNNGFLIRDGVEDDSGFQDYDTREQGGTSAPLLTITYA